MGLCLALGVHRAESLAPGGEGGAPAVKGEALEIEARWGVRVLSVRRSAGGYLLDLRYRVVDPEKSSALLDRSLRPRLIANKTGATLDVPSAPKIGSLRQSTREPKKDRTYFALFANPARLVQAGDEVTLVIGDLHVPHLVVE
jgi:hypothetical protein